MIFASADGVAGITGVATLIGAAGIGYVTLRAAGERNSAERERQAMSLAHERQLADLSDLRELLDEAARSLDAGQRAQERAKSALIYLNGNSDGHRRAESAGKAQDEIRPCLPPMFSIRARLQVRLGKDDPLTVRFERATELTSNMLSQLGMLALTQQEGVSAYLDAVDNAWSEFDDATAAFYVAAVERAGTVTAGL